MIKSLQHASPLACTPSAAHAQAPSAAAQKFPVVVSAKVTARGGQSFAIDITVLSPNDTPKRYADAFRVMSKDGKVYGERILLHDHAGEQSFTRDLYGVKVPADVRLVVIQVRDQKYGYGGKSIESAMPGR